MGGPKGGKGGRQGASAGRGYGYPASPVSAVPRPRAAPGPAPVARAAGGAGPVPQPRHAPARMNPYPAKPLPQGKGGKGQPPARMDGLAGRAPQASSPCDLLPFNVKTRRLIEHKARNPHRRTLHPFLVRVVAHWTSVPPNTSPLTGQSVDVTLTDDADAAVVSSGEEAVAADASGVDARVLLCPGLVQAEAARKQHVLSRVHLIGRKAAATGAVSCYGGRTNATNDAEAVQFLMSTVRDQCGLDLSNVVTWYKFVEFQYSTKAGNPTTVFYLPALWELSDDLKVVAQGLDEEIQHEEKVFPDLEREGMTDEEYKEAQSKLEPEIKTTTEMKRTITYTPLRLTLAQCLATELAKGQPKEVLEFYSAADALDEFLKREMTGRIAQRLHSKAVSVREKEEKRLRLEAEKVEKAKLIAEQKEAKKAENQEKLAEMREKWNQEDQGKTDDEKEDAMAERNRIEDELLNPRVEAEDTVMEGEDDTKRIATAVNYVCLTHTLNDQKAWRSHEKKARHTHVSIFDPHIRVLTFNF